MAVHKKYNRSVLGRGLDDIEGGKGLDALIDTGSVRTQGSSTISEIPLDQIEANPNQPRRDFDEEALQELATSIEQIGITQTDCRKPLPDYCRRATLACLTDSRAVCNSCIYTHH